MTMKRSCSSMKRNKPKRKQTQKPPLPNHKMQQQWCNQMLDMASSSSTITTATITTSTIVTITTTVCHFFASCLFCLPINVFVFFVRMLFFFASIIPSLTNLKVCLKFTLIDVNTLKISIYFYFIILKTFLIFFSFNLFLLFFQNKMIQFEYSKNNIVNTMGFVLTCDKFKIWEYGMNTHSK